MKRTTRGGGEGHHSAHSSRIWLAEAEAGNWADARIPGAGHRHYKILPTPEQVELIAKLERLRERVRAAR